MRAPSATISAVDPLGTGSFSVSLSGAPADAANFLGRTGRETIALPAHNAATTTMTDKRGRVDRSNRIEASGDRLNNCGKRL